jgi:hypothetical protein
MELEASVTVWKLGSVSSTKMEATSETQILGQIDGP